MSIGQNWSNMMTDIVTSAVREDAKPPLFPLSVVLRTLRNLAYATEYSVLNLHSTRLRTVHYILLVSVRGPALRPHVIYPGVMADPSDLLGRDVH